MGQEHDDYADLDTTTRTKWSRCVYAALMIAAASYPAWCFVLMRYTWPWFALNDCVGFALYVVLVPASAIGVVAALPKAGLPVSRQAIGFFALWVGFVALYQIWLMLSWYSGV